MSRGKKITIWILFITICLGILAYLLTASYYKEHFYFGTMINNIDYSGKTVQEVEEDIAEKLALYQLVITGRKGLSDTIMANDIGYHYVSDGQIAAFKREQNPYKWVFSLFNEEYQDVTATCAFDYDLLVQTVDSLLFFHPENVNSPENAFIEYNEEGFYIVGENLGSTLNRQKVIDSIYSVIMESGSSLSLEEADCYESPGLRGDNKKLEKCVDKLNKYTSLTITYDFGDRTEVLDYTLLKEWVSVDEKFKVTLDKEKVQEYVNYLGYYYTTFSSTRDFIRHDGKTISIKGGDYGWIINRSAETDALYNLIKKGKSVTREPVYSQKARSRNKNDIGSTYVEISIKKQHLWLYVDGKEIMDSPIVTGSVNKKRDTPKGIYEVTYKESNAVLNGEDYSSPVKYWMPFNHNIGCHDASWRKEFGKEIYLKNGSHGCVNMPEKNAKILFENIKKGTPVVVY